MRPEKSSLLASQARASLGLGPGGFQGAAPFSHLPPPMPSGLRLCLLPTLPPNLTSSSPPPPTRS